MRWHGLMRTATQGGASTNMNPLPRRVRFKLHRPHNARYLATRSRLDQLPALSKDANEDVEQVARVDVAREFPRLHLRAAGNPSFR